MRISENTERCSAPYCVFALIYKIYPPTYKNRYADKRYRKKGIIYMTKTGFIAILGRPNVGKSTLLNAMVGEKITIVSSKPQTTRNRITGILTEDENQYVFIDTPGMHTPRTKLGNYMVGTVEKTMGETDAAILVVEAEPKIHRIEYDILEKLKKMSVPTILVINKIDRSDAAKIAQTIQLFSNEYQFDSVVPISALKEKGIREVIDEAGKFLVESPWFFPDDMITDQPERKLVAEIIREKILRLLKDEIPHGTAVTIEEFTDEKTLIRIRAEIFCERESHKRIIIGKGGEMLKRIGTYSREDLEAFFGVKVHLDLWVKVKEKWRDSNFYLNDFGYNLKKDFE